jgi:hypothetical protein
MNKEQSDISVMCCCCLGDGKETCHNPDHGFISALSFHDIGRLGCPVCGHDPNGKVKNGGDCDLCGGTGKTTEAIGREFCVGMGYDYEEIQYANACSTCGGHGMIGGLLPNGGGYDSEPCPDCQG